MNDQVVKWTEVKAREGGKDESEGSDKEGYVIKEEELSRGVIPRHNSKSPWTQGPIKGQNKLSLKLKIGASETEVTELDPRGKA